MADWLRPCRPSKSGFFWTIIIFVFVSTYYLTEQPGPEPDSVIDEHKFILEKESANSKPEIAMVLSACKSSINELVILLKSAAFFSRDVRLKILIFCDTRLTSNAVSQKLDEIGGSAQKLGLGGSIEYELRVLKKDKKKKGTTLKPEQKPDVAKHCPSQKLELPALLPNVDAVMTLDSDLAFLGNIKDLWETFSHMNDKQFAALVSESESPGGSRYGNDSSIPFYGKYGLNTGVMLLNLTRMRQQSFSSHLKMVKATHGSQLKEGDQDLLNVLFHFFPEYVYNLPCEFNFRVSHCKCAHNETCNCEAAEKYGITILHGNRGEFQSGDEKTLNFTRDIFDAFNELKLGEEDPRKFLERLQKSYAQLQVKNETCYNSALEKNMYSKFLRYIST